MNNFLEKLRNPILISSLISTIFLILSCLNIIHITDSTINIIVNSIMSFLSIAGVLNAPYVKIDSINTSTDNNDEEIINK